MAEVIPIGEPQKRKKDPLPGTTEEAWMLLNAIQRERATLGLRKTTMAYGSAKRVTVLLEQTMIGPEFFDAIARNVALTEKSHGVVFRQLLINVHADLFLEGFCDGPWETRGGSFRPTTL